MKLVDAAHIVPVTYPQSTDEVTNGVALCRLHHGAYDNGILGICSNYRVLTNPAMERYLAELRLDDGLRNFKSKLPRSIRLPSSLEVRPTPNNLILGLRARRWPEDLIA